MKEQQQRAAERSGFEWQKMGRETVAVFHEAVVAETVAEVGVLMERFSECVGLIEKAEEMLKMGGGKAGEKSSGDEGKLVDENHLDHAFGCDRAVFFLL
jgi:hypothetical protein